MNKKELETRILELEHDVRKLTCDILFKQDKPKKSNVWIPKDKHVNFVRPQNGFSSYKHAEVYKPLLHRVYKDKLDNDSPQVLLERFISDMLEKYGWIEDINGFHLTISGGWNGYVSDNKFSPHLRQMQRSGVAMHEDSTEEEREKMARLIKEAND